MQNEGAYYHLLSRGNEGRTIFFDGGDRKLFLSTSIRVPICICQDLIGRKAIYLSCEGLKLISSSTLLARRYLM